MTHPHHSLPKKMQPSPEDEPSRAKDGQYLWQITDHCCRVCFGRILVRETFDRRRIYRCSCCGVEAQGKTEAAVCCCGVKLKTGVDAGIRCQRAEPTPEFPAEITAAQAEVAAKTDPQSVFSRS